MKLACMYARRSTDDQDGSLPAQHTQMKSYAERNGFKIVKNYEDDGISGTSLNRPGLRSLLRDAANGAQWQHILVWDRSRLGRPEDPREAIAVTFELERNGKSIVPLHGTPQTDNPVINTILEALEFGQAGEESIRKSRDVLRGQSQCAKKGSLPAGRPPYGYDALYLLADRPVRRMRYLENGTKQRLSIDGKKVLGVIGRGQREGKSADEIRILVPGAPDKVEVVRRIFRGVLDGRSTRDIAKALNSDRVLAPRGRSWGRTTVNRIIGNPCYKGTLAWNRHSWAKFHNARSDGEIARISNPERRMRFNPEDQWFTREECWEGLVSAKDWSTANALLTGRSTPPSLLGRAKGSPFLASGLLFCTCGAHFTGCGFRDKRRTEHRYEYYRCHGSLDKGPAICSARRVKRSIVDNYLEARIKALYFEPAMQPALWKAIASELKNALADIDVDGELRQAEERLRAVDAQIQRLVEAVSSGLLASSEVAQQIGPLRAEKVQLQKKLAANSDSRGRRQDPKQILAMVLDACRKQVIEEADIWSHASAEDRKKIVRAHVAKITVDEPKSRLVTEFHPLVHLPQFGLVVPVDSRTDHDAKRASSEFGAVARSS